MDIYFPSCNFAKAHPQTEKRVKQYMKEQMPVVGCCLYEKRYTPADTAVINCQACREHLDEKLGIRSVWEFLDAQADFPWPDHSGLRVNLQDCWRDRKQAGTHAAVRSLLRKMKVEAVELEQENRERALFCGNLHFESHDPENLKRLSGYPDSPIYEMPPDLEEALMREQVSKYSCESTVVYCNRCEKGVTLGGGKAVHLMTLVFPGES